MVMSMSLDGDADAVSQEMGDADQYPAGADGVWDAKVATCSMQIEQTRERLRMLQEKVKMLRLELVSADEEVMLATDSARSVREESIKRLRVENASLVDEEEGLSAQTRRNEATAAKLLEVSADREGFVGGLREKLAKKRQELEELRNKEQSRLAGTVAHTQVALLRNALYNWESPHGLKRICWEKIANADQNHVSKLQWDNGEIKHAITDIFKASGVHMPRWSETTWSHVFRHSNIESSNSFSHHETEAFARFCFEVALRALDPLGVGEGLEGGEHGRHDANFASVDASSRVDASPRVVASPSLSRRTIDSVAEPQRIGPPMHVAARRLSV